MLGYADDDIEPRFSAWERLVHPDDKSHALQVIQDFLGGRADKYEVESRMLHKDGHYVDVLSRAFGTREAPDGPIVRLVGTHVDISERKRVEAALRESEDKFRRIVEFANVGIAIVQDARFRFANPCCAAMFGYTADELLNTEFTGYCAPEERDRIVGFNAKRMKGEPAPTRYETAVLRKDRQRAYVDVSAGLIPHEGQPASFIYLVDVTERKRAEDLLRESESHMRSLIEAAKSFAIYRLAVDPANPYLGRVVVVSPSLEDLLGTADPHDFVTWFADIHPDDLPRIVEANRRSLESGAPFDEQLRFFNSRQGKWTWAHVRSTPVYDSEGKLTYF
jgi:PAS domain S-box-containing protein